MHIDVIDRLATQGVAIHRHAEAFRATLLLRQALSGEEDMPGELLVIGLAEVVQGRDVLLGNDQKVHGRLRGDVMEGHDLIVLVEHLGRNVPGDDLAEQTIHVDLLLAE